MIHDFARFCKQQDWEPVFYCAHVRSTAIPTRKKAS